jgi:hypothetical protein
VPDLSSCEAADVTSHKRGLPEQPLIERFIAWCFADERILASFLGGSYARAEADDYSDLDLCVITTDDAYEEVVAAKAAIVQKLGTPLFLEDFDLDGIVFFILDDGTEAELFFGCESRLHEISDVGPFRTLVDKTGILEGARFPWREPDTAYQLEALRRCIYWFWHELSHFIAAMGRGQLWWAYGQIEALRGLCVNLTRIEQNVGAQEEMYEKLEQVISTQELSALEPTFCSMEQHAMLRAVGDIVGFFQARAPAVAEAHGSTYPTELAALMCDRFANLVQASRR